MFAGHFGVGFAAKRVAPQVSLGTFFLAVAFVDLLWPVLLLLGVEAVEIDPGNTVVTPLNFADYPITHSLITAAGWAALFGLLYAGLRRYAKGGWLVGAAVFSHWLLDLVVHRPDLPIVPGRGPYVGLGLWNSLLGTLVVEAAIFAIGLLIYLRSTRPIDKTGSYGLGALTLVIVAAWIGNIFGPPPSEQSIAMVGNAQWILVVWAYWIDRHRQPAHRR